MIVSATGDEVYRARCLVCNTVGPARETSEKAYEALMKEIRVRKDVVEEDVRREEIDIEDQTERRTEEGQTAQTDQPQQQAEAQGAEEEGFIDKAKKKLQGQ